MIEVNDIKIEGVRLGECKLKDVIIIPVRYVGRVRDSAYRLNSIITYNCAYGETCILARCSWEVLKPLKDLPECAECYPVRLFNADEGNWYGLPAVVEYVKDNELCKVRIFGKEPYYTKSKYTQLEYHTHVLRHVSGKGRTQQEKAIEIVQAWQSHNGGPAAVDMNAYMYEYPHHKDWPLNTIKEEIPPDIQEFIEATEPYEPCENEQHTTH